MDCSQNQYQSMLRVVGAMLDEVQGRDPVVLETADSLIVRFTVDSACETREMTHEQLLEAFESLHNNRTLLGTVERGHYQDALRAIGYEMEQAHAHALLLAQAGDRYLLTYQTTVAAPTAPQTHFLMLTSTELDGLLEQARGRRAVSKHD